MKKLFITSIILLITGLSYSQTVTVHTTLLRIDGIEKGQLLMDKTLPIAWEYNFITIDTLDWSTIPIDSLQFENTQMKNDIVQLQNQNSILTNQVNSQATQINDLFTQLNGLQVQVNSKVSIGETVKITK